MCCSRIRNMRRGLLHMAKADFFGYFHEHAICSVLICRNFLKISTSMIRQTRRSRQLFRTSSLSWLPSLTSTPTCLFTPLLGEEYIIDGMLQLSNMGSNWIGCCTLWIFWRRRMIYCV